MEKSIITANAGILKYIHDPTNRRMMEDNKFRGKHKVCMLDFIGAPEFFITDFGAVFQRRNVYTNWAGYIAKGFLPLAVLDRAFPYPWVMLTGTFGEAWFPVNQLVGWAFDAQSDLEKKYYLSTTPSIMPLDMSTFVWKSELPKVLVRSRYTEWMDHLYNSGS